MLHLFNILLVRLIRKEIGNLILEEIVLYNNNLSRKIIYLIASPQLVHPLSLEEKYFFGEVLVELEMERKLII